MKNLIRSEREEHGWTQAVLAEHLNVSRQTIVAIETGKYDPSLPLAFRISRLFDKPIEDLFFPTVPEAQAAPERSRRRSRAGTRWRRTPTAPAPQGRTVLNPPSSAPQSIPGDG
ncbi:helix-turn-helix transcriptional regulator [Leekyejoonella antrihumi]|uniref:Helix-turn-helix transcriptional regulator n=1 Tax=Leekyejoonella antrihumi TaxID=1660198 RepID=A0A563DYI7_9MICO|nr:helix-turn-helix transcriptional regulator [Leekyejoonella antrihumi]